MPTTNKEREIRIAQRRVEGFAQEFGEAHHNLARHAAFPLVLTPDLLYQIWANFVPEAPWTAIAHVLLSRLCRQVGYEMYEMDIADRNLLLRELKGEFGQERFDELGEFLLDYVAQRLTDDDADTQDLREAQEWTALAYTKPGEAARELAERLSEMVESEDMGEVLRLASLVDTLAEPLDKEGFKPLLIYSKAMATVSNDEQEDTLSQLHQLISVSDKQLSTILCYLYEELGQDIFIEFINENYDDFEDVEKLLTIIYSNEYIDFESFVYLAIQTLKPDFDGKVYVKYERYYSTKDEGERYVGSLGQQSDQMHLNRVLEFITECHGDSLGVTLDNEQEIEMVLAILSTGEYELPDSDIEGGTVEISIKEPELSEDYYEGDEYYLDFEEDVESTENRISIEPKEEILATKEVITEENYSSSEQVTSPNENLTPIESITNQFSSQPSPTNQILVVDDSPDNVFLIKTILEEEGYEVSTAENGIVALSILENYTPDLITLDLMMSEMDGYEVTRRIRQNTALPFIPILIITAHESPNVAHGLDLGADDFIRKPVTVNELLARVRSLLRLNNIIRQQNKLIENNERELHNIQSQLTSLSINTTATTDVTPVVALKELFARLNQEQSKIQDLLSSLGFALRSFNNLNQFLELIPLVATRFSDADGSALFLYKSNGQLRLELEQLHWQDSRQRRNIRKALEAASSEITISLNDASVTNTTGILDEQMHRHLGSNMQIFGTAILVKHTERGWLYVLSRNPEYTWTETRQKLVRLVADQTAVAIENDELAVELHRKEKKEIIKGKLEGVPFMLSLGASVEKIAEALGLDVELVRLEAAKVNANEKEMGEHPPGDIND